MRIAFLLCLAIASISSIRGACPIENYASSSCFDNRGEEVNIDSDFRSSMDAICASAARCNVKLYITNSYRKPDSIVTGTIVPPAAMSNHKIGHAIDMNVVSEETGELCDSKCLRGKQPPEVACFIDDVKQNGLRWGGDFSATDPVHIDDGFNQNTADYRVLYKKIQEEC